MKAVAIERKLPFKRMTGSHVLVEMEEFEYKGRLVIPQTSQKPSTAVRVLQKGFDVTNVEIGDRILISQFAGYMFVFPNMGKLRIISDNEVLGVLNEDAETPEGEGV